jgi:hypothetical protein
MASRTVWTVLASLALIAAPLAAQDTTSAPKDTTGGHRDTTVAQPMPQRDTSGAARSVTPPAAQPAAAPAPAGDTTSQANAVKPGMTEAEVCARWGAPLAERTANDWTYMFYRNNRERRVGYEDVVFLQNGQVVDAIVRSSDHVYAGVSSSPEGRTPVFTPPQGQPADSTKGAAVTGVRVKPGQ